MAGNNFDSDFLLTQVRRLSYAPTAKSLGGADSDILALATFEMHAELVPKLRAINEEYFVVSKGVFPDIVMVSGTDTYAIPTRAVAGTLRDVWVVQSSGALQRLPRLEPSQVPIIGAINPSQTGTPIGFYLQGNNVVLFPAPGSGAGSLRLMHEQRPSDIVGVAAVAVVSAINILKLFSFAY